uniref:Uncharacterized protein n=1 Tax=Anguilla anguilla TaxID=7936 RepID=A0A0E9SSC2_ANGAN
MPTGLNSWVTTSGFAAKGGHFPTSQKCRAFH